MSYLLFHQWAPRPLRLWVWVLIISLIAGGPVGLLAGVVMGIIAIPLGFGWHLMHEMYEWSSDNASLLGSKPSDKLRMSEKYRL
jgi:thiamine transporter ThiT